MVAGGKKWEKCLSSYFLMFIGEYSHTLDEKGRLSVPKKFRDDLAGGAVVTRGFDSCLFLFTKREWEKLAENVASLSFAQANNRAFSRLVLAGAMDVEVDKQGRVMLPEYLRVYAGIAKDVVVAGLYNRLELWNSTTWAEYKKRTEADSNTIAEQMAALGV